MKKFRRSAGVILKHGDEVLLCKRSPDETMPNVWSIPSGGIEEGESPGQAAIREFYEETNIEIGTNLELVGMVDKFNDDGTKRGMMFVFFQETKDKKQPNLDKATHGHEHTECGYFKVDDMPKQKENQELYKIIKKVMK
jgi:ADP-ribose pyrophosphatase YjhB (NUDIX family)